MRRFGTWLVLEGVDLELYLTAKNGPEPLGPRFTSAWLVGQLTWRRALLKAVLLDQRVVAGLGNIYADEALGALAEPAAPGERARRRRGRSSAPGDSRRAANGHRAPGLDARDYATPDGSAA